MDARLFAYSIGLLGTGCVVALVGCEKGPIGVQQGKGINMIEIQEKQQLPLSVGKEVVISGVVKETAAGTYIYNERGDFRVDLPCTAQIAPMIGKAVTVRGMLGVDPPHPQPSVIPGEPLETDYYDTSIYHIKKYTVIRKTKAPGTNSDEEKPH
jgi:hypothetical protein